MKRILATMLLVCVVVSGVVMLSSCEKNEFTSMIPGLNATIDKVQELTHVHKLELVDQVDPTCNDAGTKSYYACKGCDAIFADEKGEMVITAPDLIERLAHVYDDEYDADCNLCGAVRAAKCRHANTTVLASKTENCTETGLTAGEKCLDCNETIIAQEIIPALDHLYDNDTDTTCNRTGCGYERCIHTNTEAAGVATESTCSVHGMTAGEKCSDCGEILVAQEELPLAPHTEVKAEAVAAGCITAGLTEGTKCSACGAAIKAQETVAATGHKWEGISCTTCSAVKFEAENAAFVTDIERAGQGLQSNKTLEQANYPSGDGYVYYLSDDGNATLTFTVNASKAGKAVLSFRMGLTKYEYTASKLFTLTVNNKECEYYSSAVFPTYEDAGVIIYFGWYEVEVAEIDLVEGNNTIVLTRNTNGMNFDYIALRSTDGAAIGTADCSKDGHAYGDWKVTTAPTSEAAGEIKKSCSACSDVQTATIPAVSTENGYTLVSDGITSVWEYTYDGNKITVSISSASESTKYTFVAGKETDPFIAANDGSTSSTLKTEDGVGTYYGNASNKSFTYTFKVNVEKATNVTLLIRCAKRYGPYEHSALFGSLTINGSTDGVNYTGDTIEWGTTKEAWGDFKDYALATLSLNEGTNTIEFTVITSCNVEAVIIESIIPVYLGEKE